LSKTSSAAGAEAMGVEAITAYSFSSISVIVVVLVLVAFLEEGILRLLN
jgi:hypothetical protein